MPIIIKSVLKKLISLKVGGVLLIFLLVIQASGCQKKKSQKASTSTTSTTLPAPPFRVTNVYHHPEIQHPSDLIEFQNKLVATDLRNNRLTIFEDFHFQKIEYFDPQSIGQSFQSPHFLAVSAQQTLLITNGWGNSIVEIHDLKGAGWKEFRGLGTLFNAPHGICVDAQGWIYVGDSLNSRLVRFRDLQGRDWQVFADVQKRVAYIRQLLCEGHHIWIANAYVPEKPQINPGQGGNILKITNFESGEVEEVVHHPLALNGLVRTPQGELLVNPWDNVLYWKPPQSQTLRAIVGFQPENLGIPYGMRFLPKTQSLVATYFGNLRPEEGTSRGGFALIEDVLP